MKKIICLLCLLFLGTIILFAQVNKSNPRQLARWQSNIIRVSWINPTAAPDDKRKVVESAVKETWQKQSGGIFKWCNNKDNMNGIRIKILDDTPHTNPAV